MKRVHGERKEDENYLQLCEPCQGYKAPRSHHCKKCNDVLAKVGIRLLQFSMNSSEGLQV